MNTSQPTRPRASRIASSVWPRFVRALEVRRLQAKCSDGGVLALTYDDGPNEGITRRLLHLLGERGTKATFFMEGRKALANRALVDEVAAAGHEIGCHSHEHLDPWEVSSRAANSDIEDGFDSLGSWVSGDGIFRPPYGRLTLSTRRLLRRRGARIGWWTLDSMDTYDNLPPPDDVPEVIRERRGGVVLLHDLDRSRERDDYVVDVTRRLIDTASEEGLEIRPLGELL